jgi:hypothetical protein
MRQLVIDLDEKDQDKENLVVKILDGLGLHYQTYDRQTIEEYNDEIDESVAQYARGEFISMEELEKRAQKW